MNKVLFASLIGLGLLMTPAISSAAPADGSMVVAQNIRIGPNGVRVDDGRGRRGFERNRFERRREVCRTVIVRHRTPYGMRTERVRRCG
jgi:hypothetical protein